MSRFHTHAADSLIWKAINEQIFGYWRNMCMQTQTKCKIEKNNESTFCFFIDASK